MGHWVAYAVAAYVVVDTWTVVVDLLMIRVVHQKHSVALAVGVVVFVVGKLLKIVASVVVVVVDVDIQGSVVVVVAVLFVVLVLVVEIRCPLSVVVVAAP